MSTMMIAEVNIKSAKDSIQGYGEVNAFPCMLVSSTGHAFSFIPQKVLSMKDRRTTII